MNSRFIHALFVSGALLAGLGAAPRNENPVTTLWFNFNNAADWKTEGSRYLKVTNGVTNATLKVYSVRPVGLGPIDNQASNSLALLASWDRKNYNWIDLIPSKDQPVFDGRITSFDMWVWGGNFDYGLEAHIQDYQGINYVVPFGKLNYFGWKNLIAEIPSTVPQTMHTYPRNRGVKFLKFRINTSPKELVDNFLVLFNYFKVTSDMFRPPFDGSDVENVVNSDLMKGQAN